MEVEEKYLAIEVAGLGAVEVVEELLVLVEVVDVEHLHIRHNSNQMVAGVECC